MVSNNYLWPNSHALIGQWSCHQDWLTIGNLFTWILSYRLIFKVASRDYFINVFIYFPFCLKIILWLMFIKLILLILLIVSILTEQHTSNTKNIRLSFRLVLYADWLMWVWSHPQTKWLDETCYVGLILLTMVLIHTCYPSLLSTDCPSLFILTFEEMYKELEKENIPEYVPPPCWPGLVGAVQRQRVLWCHFLLWTAPPFTAPPHPFTTTTPCTAPSFYEQGDGAVQRAVLSITGSDNVTSRRMTDRQV